MDQVIKTDRGFVAGFNSEHQVIQFTPLPFHAKSFKNVKAAQRWIDKYSNAGYGSLEGATIENHPLSK